MINLAQFSAFACNLTPAIVTQIARTSQQTLAATGAVATVAKPPASLQTEIPTSAEFSPARVKSALSIVGTSLDTVAHARE